MAKSLILVTVDCLRADHTGFLGYASPTTPFLDRLAGESFVFPRAIATGAPTYYSFPGIMASRFPLALGREVVGLAPGETTLATVLKSTGYRTAAFVAGNPYLSSSFHYEEGFEIFRDFLSEVQPSTAGQGDERGGARMRTRLNERIGRVAHNLGPLGTLYDELYFQYCQRIAASGKETWDGLRRYPAADVLVDRTCDWLASTGDRPFFLWLHFMDPHAPYYPPAEALKALGAEIGPARARYLNSVWNRGDIEARRLRKYRDDIVLLHDAGIRWVDTQLARLIDTLRNLSRWDSSVFALTADHGEEFLDRGGTFHPPSQTHQEMLRVPLLIRVPGEQKKQLSDAPFSHLHLGPTLLEALEVPIPGDFEGRSYWTELQRGGGWDLAISESVGSCTNPMDATKRMGRRKVVVQERRYKLVVDFELGAEQLFDLDSDPSELRTLPLEAEKAVRVRLLRAALQHCEHAARRPKAELSMRARVRRIGLEWSHTKMQSATLTS